MMVMLTITITTLSRRVAVGREGDRSWEEEARALGGAIAAATVKTEEAGEEATTAQRIAAAIDASSNQVAVTKAAAAMGTQ